MAIKMQWDKTGERYYTTGVEKMVLYRQMEQDGKVVYDKGVAWNGISGVTESPSGGDENKIYADNQKYLSLYAAEDYGSTIEAYYSPEEFDECDGTTEVAPGVTVGQQNRKGFGYCYQTRIGNDVDGDAKGYEIIIVYNAKAQPSDRTHTTTNESPDASTCSWTVTTTPERFDNEHKASAFIKLNSLKVPKATMERVESLLYGSDSTDAEKKIVECDPQLPLMADIIKIVNGEEYTPQVFPAG